MLEIPRLARLHNAARRKAGLHRLRWDVALARSCHEHARTMAREGWIFHDPDLEQVASKLYDGTWKGFGENVGLGPKQTTLEDAFMGSEEHRANILGDYTDFGIGLDRREGLWVCVRFVKR